MKRITVKVGNHSQDSTNRYHYISKADMDADNTADIPVGSVALVLPTGIFYFLNEDDEWEAVGGTEEAQ